LRMAGLFMPDLVLLDIDMPEIDGWETARLLRANHITLAPILIVSANAFDSDLRNDVGVGREDFIVKPLHIDDLLERVRAKLGLVWTTPDDLRVRAMPTPSGRLPPARLAALQQLGEMGYLRGILESLDELDLLDACLMPLTATLRDCVQRFDLKGFARVLAESQAST